MTQRYASFTTIICIIMCLTVNYTFPLDRHIKWTKNRNYTHNNMCKPLQGTRNIVDRTKKMANNIEDAMKRFQVSAEEVYQRAMEKKNLSDEDLRQYEQLVIIKKYPYLDLKEIEYKYNTADKRTRQSLKDDSGAINTGVNDPGLCEPPDNINVEIFNRGLSGFTIPKKFAKGLSTIDAKIKVNDLKMIQEKIEGNKAFEKPQDGLRSLRSYIEAYLPVKKL